MQVCPGCLVLHNEDTVIVDILSDQSIVCSIFTSPFVSLQLTWNLDGIDTKTSISYQVLSTAHEKAKKIRKVKLLVENHAVKGAIASEFLGW